MFGPWMTRMVSLRACAAFCAVAADPDDCDVGTATANRPSSTAMTNVRMTNLMRRFYADARQSNQPRNRVLAANSPSGCWRRQAQSRETALRTHHGYVDS